MQNVLKGVTITVSPLLFRTYGLTSAHEPDTSGWNLHGPRYYADHPVDASGKPVGVRPHESSSDRQFCLASMVRTNCFGKLFRSKKSKSHVGYLKTLPNSSIVFLAKCTLAVQTQMMMYDK